MRLPDLLRLMSGWVVASSVRQRIHFYFILLFFFFFFFVIRPLLRLSVHSVVCVCCCVNGLIDWWVGGVIHPFHFFVFVFSCVVRRLYVHVHLLLVCCQNDGTGAKLLSLLRTGCSELASLTLLDCVVFLPAMTFASADGSTPNFGKVYHQHVHPEGWEGKKASHIPSLVIKGDVAYIHVDHVMTEDHYINAIYVRGDIHGRHAQVIYYKELTPESPKAVARFTVRRSVHLRGHLIVFVVSVSRLPPSMITFSPVCPGSGWRIVDEALRKLQQTRSVGWTPRHV